MNSSDIITARGVIGAGPCSQLKIRIGPGQNGIALIAAFFFLNVLLVPVRGQVSYTYITNFLKSGNLQSNLQASFPSGLYTATNGLATTFDITTNAAGKNFYEIYPSSSPLVVSNIGLPGVMAVYTIMNAYTPGAGALASVTFIGSGGARQTFTLTGNSDIRDFYNGFWDNSINGATAQQAYGIDNVVGGAGTGNSGTGDTGTYRLDEQEFQLNSALQGQWLETIVISNVNSGSTPFLAAITAQQTNATLPFSETFTNPAVNPGWTFFSGNPLSTNSLNGSELDIIASYANGGSDLYSGTEYWAPRLLQPVNPALDWIITTAFAFSPADNYQGAGILLANTNGAFSGDANFSRIAERAFYPGGGGSVIRSVGNYVGYANAVSYLRVEKTGTNYTGWYCSDGTNWTLNGTASATNEWTYAGVFVIRYPWDSAPVNSDAAFYYFDIEVLLPKIAIQNAESTNVNLSWPGSSLLYGLQQCSPLKNGPWNFSTNFISVVNGSNTVTMPASSSAQFYRLVYP